MLINGTDKKLIGIFAPEDNEYYRIKLRNYIHKNFPNVDVCDEHFETAPDGQVVLSYDYVTLEHVPNAFVIASEHIPSL